MCTSVKLKLLIEHSIRETKIWPHTLDITGKLTVHWDVRLLYILWAMMVKYVKLPTPCCRAILDNYISTQCVHCPQTWFRDWDDIVVEFQIIGAMSLLRRSVSPKVRCSEGLLLRRSDTPKLNYCEGSILRNIPNTPKVQYSEGSLLRRSIIPKVRYSES